MLLDKSAPLSLCKMQIQTKISLISIKLHKGGGGAVLTDVLTLSTRTLTLLVNLDKPGLCYSYTSIPTDTQNIILMSMYFFLVVKK